MGNLNIFIKKHILKKNKQNKRMNKFLIATVLISLAVFTQAAEEGKKHHNFVKTGTKAVSSTAYSELLGKELYFLNFAKAVLKAEAILNEEKAKAAKWVELSESLSKFKGVFNEIIAEVKGQLEKHADIYNQFESEVSIASEPDV